MPYALMLNWGSLPPIEHSFTAVKKSIYLVCNPIRKWPEYRIWFTYNFFSSFWSSHHLYLIYFKKGIDLYNGEYWPFSHVHLYTCVDNHNVPMVSDNCGHLLVWPMYSMGFSISTHRSSSPRKKAVGNKTCIHSQVSVANTGNFVSFSDDSLGKHSKMIKECE